MGWVERFQGKLSDKALKLLQEHLAPLQDRG